MHNWFEDKCKYKKEKHVHNLEYGLDYQQSGYQKADATIRRGTTIKDDKKPPKYDLYRHDGAYADNMISWYDADYGKRTRNTPENYLPPLRSFSTQVMAWVPERSDYPIRGKPTSWGLAEKKRQQWAKQMESLNLGRTPQSDYKEAFVAFPTEYLKETVRKKYDVSALTASSTQSCGRTLDPLVVAAATGNYRP